MSRINGFIDSFNNPAGYRQHGGIWSGISLRSTIIHSSGSIDVSGYRNVTLQAAGDSGIFTFRGGAYQGWAVRNLTDNGGGSTGGPMGDGFFPLAVSGQYSLQDAYFANRQLIVSSAGNALNIITDDRKFVLITGRRAPLNISGVLQVPAVGTAGQNDPGDIAFCYHSVVLPGIQGFVFPADTAESQAKALGLGTLTVNTGSGIANLSYGSGVCQYRFASYAGGNTFPLPDAAPETFVRVPFDTQDISDKNYQIDTGSSGVAIFSPGLYKCSYQVSLRRTAGNAQRTYAARAILAPGLAGGAAGVASISAARTINGSISYAQTNNTGNNQYATLTSSFLFNANAGDFFGIEVAFNNLALNANATNITTSGTIVVLEKIGPRRGNF